MKTTRTLHLTFWGGQVFMKIKDWYTIVKYLEEHNIGIIHGETGEILNADFEPKKKPRALKVIEKKAY